MLYAAKEVLHRKQKESSGHHKRITRNTTDPHLSVHDGSASRITPYGSADRLKLCDNLFITDITGDFLRHYLRYGPNPDIVYTTKVGALPYFLKMFDVDIDIDYNKFSQLTVQDAAFFTADARIQKVVGDFNFHKPTIFEIIVFLYCIYMNTSFHGGVDEYSQGVPMRGKCTPRLVEFLETGMTKGNIDTTSLEIEQEWNMTADALKAMDMADLFATEDDYNFITRNDSRYSFSQFLFQLFSPECTGERRLIPTNWLRDDIVEVENLIIQAQAAQDASDTESEQGSETDEGENNGGENNGGGNVGITVHVNNPSGHNAGGPTNSLRNSTDPSTDNSTSSSHISGTQDNVQLQQHGQQIPEAQNQQLHHLISKQQAIVPQHTVQNAPNKRKAPSFVISPTSSAVNVIVMLSKKIQFHGGIDALSYKLLSLLMYYAHNHYEDIMPCYHHNKAWVQYCFDRFDNLSTKEQEEAAYFFKQCYNIEILHSRVRYGDPMQHFRAITYKHIEHCDDIPNSHKAHQLPPTHKHMALPSNDQINHQHDKPTSSQDPGNDSGIDKTNDGTKDDNLDNHEHIEDKDQQKMPALPNQDIYTAAELFGSTTKEDTDEEEDDDEDDEDNKVLQQLRDTINSRVPLTPAATLPTTTDLIDTPDKDQNADATTDLIDTPDEGLKVDAKDNNLQDTIQATKPNTTATTKTAHTPKKAKAAKTQVVSSYNTRHKSKAATAAQVPAKPSPRNSSTKRKHSPSKNNSSEQQQKKNKTKH